MESKTNRQISERLTALARQLVLSGDAIADTRLIEAVTSLEQMFASQGSGGDRPDAVDGAGVGLKPDGARDLSTVVEGIKATTASGRPLSERFREEVFNRDRTRCVASIVFEDNWNGLDGWKSPKDFWDMVVFVWRNAPDFFEDYDPEREILEEPSRWTQRYFDEQRNFLRHNFCLRRLCHLVMVYEHLHGSEVVAKKPLPVPPSNSRVVHTSVPPATRARHSFLRGIIEIGCVTLALVISAYLLGVRNGEKHNDTTMTQDKPIYALAKQTNKEPVGKTIPDSKENVQTDTVVCAEVKKQTAQSNEVTKTTIALQETAHDVGKAPVRRSANLATKE